MVWVRYLFEGKALVVWGVMLLIAVSSTKLLLKFGHEIVSIERYTNEFIFVFWGILLLIRGILFGALIASFAGILFLLTGLALLIKHTSRFEKWGVWIISFIFILIGLCFRAVDILLVGILYLASMSISRLFKVVCLNEFFILSGLIILVGAGLALTAHMQLQAPFIELERGSSILNEKNVKLKVNANPNSSIEVWKIGEKCSKKYVTNKYGVTDVYFYKPGNYKLKVRKNGHVAIKKVHIKASSEYLQYKAHRKLLENNRKGIKEKLKIISKDLIWNKDQDDCEYFVNIEGITSPNTTVTVSNKDGYDRKKVNANKKGHFSIRWECYDNSSEKVIVNVINNGKTKENSQKLKIKTNKELKKREEQKEKEQENNSASDSNTDDSLVDKNNNDKYKNSYALKVAVESYIIARHPEAEVDPTNYNIQKISSEMYKIYGSYNSNGVNYQYGALAMDDGENKVEILQLANLDE